MTLDKQYLDLRNKYPYLYFYQERGLIRGTIFVEGEGFRDSYEVEIVIPARYPQQLPRAREIGSIIPQTYHHNTPEDTLCLETPFTIWEIFRQNETLLNYVDNLLVPYLSGYSYYLHHGIMPFGEHAHGAEGVIEDYKRRFNIESDLNTIGLLRIIVEDAYRGHLLCPCGSQISLRKCHGKILLAMKAKGYEFTQDYIRSLDYFKKKGVNIAPYISKHVQDVVSRMQNSSDKNNKKWGYL